MPEHDTSLTEALGVIAHAFRKPEEWADKYGTHVDNEVFMMRPFCDCQREGCAWCGTCECDWGSEEGDCDHCTNAQRYAEAGGEPGRGAPNFWHKPSGFKVWWYRHIGRSMQTSGDLPDDLIASCLAAHPDGIEEGAARASLTVMNQNAVSAMDSMFDEFFGAKQG
jgi:hypothetical protein